MIEGHYNAEARAVAVHLAGLKKQAAPDDRRLSFHDALRLKLGHSLASQLPSFVTDTARTVSAPATAKAEQAAVAVAALSGRVSSLGQDVSRLTQALEVLAEVNAELVGRLARLEGTR